MSTQLPPPPPGSAGGSPRQSWIALLYFYLVAIIGLVIVITGAIIAVNSFVDWIFFDPPPDPPEGEFYGFYEDRDDKLKVALQGLLTAAIGAPIFWWHLREARRRDAG